ncbi:MAG: glycosyltransferase family 2 protein [Vicinamibacterales bacterium]
MPPHADRVLYAGERPFEGPNRGSGPMTFGAVLGVKDEVELIGPSIAHLRAIGVDAIAVSDFGSTDGTLDVLSDERRMGDVTITHVDPDVVYDYDTCSANDIAQAHRTGADWVLFLDADEFFVPAQGSLRHCRGLSKADVLVLDRYNVVTSATHLHMPVDLSPATYEALRLFTRQVADFQAVMAREPDVPFISIRPGPKVMARRAVAADVAPGGHDVSAAGEPLRRVAADDLIVAHVPFTTMGRFERKVANIRREMIRHPRYFDGEFAWHWRRWAEMTAPGVLEGEFARQVTSHEALRCLEDAGLVRTAARLFAERAANASAAETGRLGRWRALVEAARTDAGLRPLSILPARS